MNKSVIIFHKNKQPALQTLEKVKPAVEIFEKEYKISYYDIDDPKNLPLLKQSNLEGIHSPFAIVINGKFSAEVDNKVIEFLYFPDYMHFMGNHMGNWTLDLLTKVLEDNSFLCTENILQSDGSVKHGCGCS